MKKLEIFFAIPKKLCNFAPANKTFGLWCNGNTADSGPAFPGSNPGSPTTLASRFSARFLVSMAATAPEALTK